MKRLGWLAPALIALGCLLRLRQYLAARPLWLDEAMLALNIAARDYRALLRPLTNDQAAPVPFLWLERAATQLFGVNELALRALPLLAGCLLLLCMWRVARRLFDPPAAYLALAFAVCSPALIYYSNETKPYGLDACVTALVVLAALQVLERPGDRRPWRLLLAVGAAAAVASVPAFFVLAGVGLALIAAPGFRAAGGWRRLALATLCWGGPFIAVYLLVYRAPASNPYMKVYWTPYFLSPGAPGFVEHVRAALGETLASVVYGDAGPLWRLAALALLLPVAAGAWALWRRRMPSVAVLLAAPIVLALVASAAGRYPFALRLVLFSAPLLICLLVAGLAQLAEWMSPGKHLRALFPLAALGLAGALLNDARDWSIPPRRQDVAPLVAAYRSERSADQPIYVFARTVPAWLFYTTDWRAPDLARVNQLAELVSSGGPAFRNAPSRSRPVRQEGSDLNFDRGGWRELIGIPTGQGPSAAAPTGSALPDSGWAENEATRIRAATSNDAWLLLASIQQSAADSLMAALIRVGGHPAGRWNRTDALLLRYTFDQRQVP